MTAPEFAARVHAKPAGEGWLAKCPAHDDQRASLSIGTGTDARVLLKCHAGCDPDAICTAAGMTLADLYAHPTAKPTIAATYNYTDEFSTLLYQVVRFDPKDFRQRRPTKGTDWTWKLGDVQDGCCIACPICDPPRSTSWRARRTPIGSRI